MEQPSCEHQLSLASRSGEQLKTPANAPIVAPRSTLALGYCISLAIAACFASERSAAAKPPKN